MQKIKKGDQVIVIAGKDKGRKGTVLSVEGNMLMVEDINTVKKHIKPNPNTGENGGIVIQAKPIQRSNVMVYDQISAKASRIGIRTLEDGRKVRYFKSNNEVVDIL